MKFQVELDPAKYPHNRATFRAHRPAKIHGPFHRKMTAWRPRCPMCATLRRPERRIPTYRALCYQCEITLLLSRIADQSLKAKAAFDKLAPAAREAALEASTTGRVVSRPRRRAANLQ